MNNIRLLLGYCPVYGKDLGQELVRSNAVSFCYNATGGFCCSEEEDKIISFNFNLGVNSTYENIFDLNQMPALSKKLIDQMKPYESTAIKLGWRRTNYPIVDYETEKRNYYKHLRFWNYILEKYDINALFFEEIPHMSYPYVIYCLGIIKKIPMLLCDKSSIPEVRIYGTSIEQMGVNIQRYYENVASKMRVEDCVLSGRVAEYYKKYKNSVTSVKSEREKSGYEKKELARTTKQYFGRYWGINKFVKPFKWKIHLITCAVRRKNGLNWYKKHLNEARQLKEDCHSIRFLMKNRVLYQKQYNKIAQEPDYSKKYIYFGLQLTPEETTMPRAGVFSEQYTSVQLLARAAEKAGVIVYVKEHFVQAFRDRQVYEILQQIPNVYLIKTTVSSFELMDHCIAAATQTGSCILEGALLGKPILVTSEGNFWKGLYNVFEIEDEDQGAGMIREILKGTLEKPDDIKRYFYSIQNNSVFCYIQDEWWAQSDHPEHRETIQRLSALFNRFFHEELIPKQEEERKP